MHRSQTPLNYLEGGDTLHAFVADFPSVAREQAIAALGLGTALLIAEAARR